MNAPPIVRAAAPASIIAILRIVFLLETLPLPASSASGSRLKGDIRHAVAAQPNLRAASGVGNPQKCQCIVGRLLAEARAALALGSGRRESERRASPRGNEPESSTKGRPMLSFPQTDRSLDKSAPQAPDKNSGYRVSRAGRTCWKNLTLSCN